MIMQMVYFKTIGRKREERIAFFDNNKIKEDEVMRYIKAEESSPYILDMSKRHFDNVFVPMVHSLVENKA